MLETAMLRVEIVGLRVDIATVPTRSATTF